MKRENWKIENVELMVVVMVVAGVEFGTVYGVFIAKDLGCRLVLMD